MIIGTPGNDVIAALRGNDRAFAGAGDDVVCLGPGNDFARGQQGIDILLGGAGRISGASFWQAAFLKSTTLFTNLVGLGDSRSQVFGIAPSVNGQAQFVSIAVENTSAQNSVFQIATIGPQGVLLELDETLLPGEVAQFTGTLSAGAVDVAVLSGAVNWQFNVPNR